MGAICVGASAGFRNPAFVKWTGSSSIRPVAGPLYGSLLVLTSARVMPFWQCVHGQTQQAALQMISRSFEHSMQWRNIQNSQVTHSLHILTALSISELRRFNRVCTNTRFPAKANPVQQQASAISQLRFGAGFSNPQYGHMPPQQT